MAEPRGEYDVAIIGYGPTGGVLANLLGQEGLRVLVLEKDAAIHDQPRAIHFDGEVMRVFQAAGLRDQATAISRPGIQGMHFINAEGRTLLIRGGTAALGHHGCASNYYFHQPQLEAVLREGVKRFANVDVRLCHEVLEVTDGTGTMVTVSARDEGTGEVATFSARYVVGCDGARSLVRRTTGAPMEDLGLHQPWLVFDVLLHGQADLPAYTVQVCDPARPMTYCNVVGNRRRWEIMLMPGDDPVELLKPGNLWPLVARWVRPEQASIERAAIYTFHSVIAKGWRSGRLLLAGDAAHQTPPFLGQGMCAGVRDAANLAWKLAAICANGAPDALLDSYETERSPHVRAVIELAVRLGAIIQTTDPQEAQARDLQFAQGQPKVFETPAPALALTSPGPAHPQIGRPFPQPALDDGQLLDTKLGFRFAVLGMPQLLAQASAGARDHWRRAGVAVLERPGAAVTAWLQSQGIQAALLRPDRYIMAVAHTPAELEQISAHLPGSTNR